MSQAIWYKLNMTSNTTPSPYVITSSTSRGGYEDWKAFDGKEDYGHWSPLVSSNAWIMVDYGSAKSFTKLKLQNGNTNSTATPKNIKVEASIDGVIFDTLLTRTLPQIPIGNSWDVFDINPNENPYRYYKITLLNNYGHSGATQLGEVTFGYTDYRRLILKNPQTNQHYSLADKTLIPLPDSSSSNILAYGIEAGKEIDLAEDFDKITTINSDGTTTTNSVSPYSVYDYISENPQVIIYTETTDDIVLTTITEPYDCYEEFGDEVEVLSHTGDVAVTGADLILEANWSPIDELEGDFEIVTWTEEEADTAQRVLEMRAVPKPQFVKMVNPKNVYGRLNEVLAIDKSMTYKDEVRYLFTDENERDWYVWDFEGSKFTKVDISTHELILQNGMKWDDIALVTEDNWRTWQHDFINIGVFLKDNNRDTIISSVENIIYESTLPRQTTEVEKANFYILNTTAKIDINITGNTIEGVLGDEDLSRVQYRVLLNGNTYFPLDGSFTVLSAPPQNINISIPSKDIKIDDWNVVRVEFKDSFGTVDYWQTSFMGVYSGLLFKDIAGDYYSNEIGEVFKYLDFGIIVAGQTTIEHEIILKNQYGYDVKNLQLYANTSNFPDGMNLQFSKTLSPFVAEKDLLYTEVIRNNQELPFYVRISTVLGATPDINGLFDIIVKADKV